MRRIAGDTAQTLVGVTITSVLLLAAVSAATGSQAQAWATVVIAVLVVAMALGLMGAIRARDRLEDEIAADRAASQRLAEHVEATADAIRAEIEELRAMTFQVSVLEDETSAMNSTLDRAESEVDDLAVVVAAVAAAPTQPEVVDVWRTVRRAVYPLAVAASGDEHQFALTSRRGFETVLRLVTSTLSVPGNVTVTVQTVDEVVKVTVASEDGGLEPDEIDQVFGDAPCSPFAIEGPFRRIGMARFVARHLGGDIAYVRALGRSNYVVSMPAVETPEVDETPPILTLTLPLESAADEDAATRGGDGRRRH